MNPKVALILSSVVASIVIAMAVGVVLSGWEPMASAKQPVRLSAAAIPDERQPDPEAQGVIVAGSNGNFYAFTAQGVQKAVRQPPYPANGVSPDGNWQAGINCDNAGCFVAIFDLRHPDNPEMQKTVRLQASFTGGEWAPKSSMLAALDEDGGLYLVDPISGEATLTAQNVTAYAWGAVDELVFATLDGSRPHLSRLEQGGQPLQLAALSGPITRFYVSPDRDEIVFTQDDPDGWRLLMLRSGRDTVEDFGNLGRAPGKVRTWVLPAEPQLAVAWSPRGDRFAVGPVSEPYVMYVVLTEGSWKLAYSTYTFQEGYAGELAWSPDGAYLAISTYSPDRTQHEVYLMDGDADGAPRHVLDGCKIVWSPDGKFIAVKREPHDSTGIAAIRVDTGFHWSVTTHPDYYPLSWAGDEDAALALAMKPVPYAVQLGK